MSHVCIVNMEDKDVANQVWIEKSNKETQLLNYYLQEDFSVVLF